ncbi:MAG: E3 binding domain-containing protein, partial [Pseudomonadales bacterium]
MPTEIYLIKVGMNMTEGLVEEWCIPDGGQVAVGDLLYRLETEKVNLDVDAETAGTVKHVVGEGVNMKPGDVIGYIYAAGESIPDSVAGGDAGAPEPSVPTPEPAAEQASVTPIAQASTGGRLLSSPAARRLAGELGVDITTVNGTGPTGRIVEADIKAAAAAGQGHAGGAGPSSPIARKLAREHGIDLSSITGTGPGGRITKEDVEAAAATRSGAPMAPAAMREPAAVAGPSESVPVRGMRKTIAARMHDS